MQTVENVAAVEAEENADPVAARKEQRRQRRQDRHRRWVKDMKKDYPIYLLFIPIAVFFIIFNYVPMFGIIIAFKDYRPGRGVFGSEWAEMHGFENFYNLFSNESFPKVFRNTCVMAAMNLSIGFLAPVILGLLLSQVRFKGFKRVAQTVSYMPYFVATVVVCSLIKDFMSDTGVITDLFVAMGANREDMLTNTKYFWWINTLAGVWQGAGYGSIVYVAAISNINPDLHEAAALDGAGRWQRLWHITIPSIIPTIIMMFTMSVGTVFMTGFDKVLLLYNESIYDTADCLSTFTYRWGVVQNNYGLSSAAGLFQSVISTALLLLSNKLTKVAAKTSLF